MVCTESVAYQDLEYLNNRSMFPQNNTAWYNVVKVEWQQELWPEC